MSATRRITLFVAFSLVSGCGADATSSVSTSPLPAATIVAAPSLQFTPATINLVHGGTVTFQFGSVAHDVFFDNDPAGAPENIATASANTSIARTFNTPGRFVFNCHIHPGMTGVVVVQ